MRVVMQRVTQASVTVDEKIVSKIDQGLLILLGIEDADTSQDVDWLIGKICKMRIFDDVDGKMNLSLMDTAGESLVVSQFTLHANVKKGNRPSFAGSAPPEQARALFDYLVAQARRIHPDVATGRFATEMQVHMVNSGPITIPLDID